MLSNEGRSCQMKAGVTVGEAVEAESKKLYGCRECSTCSAAARLTYICAILA